MKECGSETEQDAQHYHRDRNPKEFHKRYYKGVSLQIVFGRRVFAPSWLMTSLTVLLLGLFLSLGRWQWERGDYKETLLQAYAQGAERRDLGNLSVTELPRFSAVRVSGRWDVERQFLLDNRTRDGRAGYEVLTPLQLADGRWLIVNRGWVPFEGYRDRLPPVHESLPPDQAEVLVAGRLDELPSAGLAGGRAAPAVEGPWPRVTSFPQFGELATALATPDELTPRVEPRVLLLDEEIEAGYLRDWRPFAVGKGPEQNWSYAIQWWSFALLLLVLYVTLNLKKREQGS